MKGSAASCKKEAEADEERKEGGAHGFQDSTLFLN